MWGIKLKRKTAFLKSLFAVFVLSLFLNVRVYAQKVAPGFTLTDIDGNTFSLSDYRGKTIILEFFSIR